MHDIVNDETLNLIRQALKTYKVPEGQQRYNSLPRWPGLVFAIETDEGKAMLGKRPSSTDTHPARVVLQSTQLT